ncbi:MAG: MFS transporter [Actinomycetota bacterium]
MAHPGVPDPARLSPVILLQAANLASGVGNSVVLLTIPWLVLERTGSAASAGLVAAVSALPALVAAPLAGWLVDRFGRRQVSVASDVLSALSVAGFPLVALATELTFPVILLLAVVGATFDPSGYTARRSLLPDVAAAARRPVDPLNGLHEGVFAVGWTVGPLVGASLIATVGAVNSFWAPFALFLLAAVLVAVMRVGDAGQAARAAAGPDSADSGWASLARGITIILADRPIRSVTIAVVVLAAIYLPTEAVLLPTHFERLDEPGSLGIVIAAISAGSIVGSFGYGWLAARLRASTIARLALGGIGVAIVPMSFLPPLPILAAGGLLLGLSWGPANPLMTSQVQRRVPPDEQGRVFGVQLSAFSAAPPLAMLVVGAAVDQVGLSTTYLALAAVFVAFTVLAILAPHVRELDE